MIKKIFRSIGNLLNKMETWHELSIGIVVLSMGIGIYFLVFGFIFLMAEVITPLISLWFPLNFWYGLCTITVFLLLSYAIGRIIKV